MTDADEKVPGIFASTLEFPFNPHVAIEEKAKAAAAELHRFNPPRSRQESSEDLLSNILDILVGIA